MSDHAIFYPLIALVVLTFVVAVLMRRYRDRARREGLDPQYFALNSGAEPPEYLIQVTQHYDNLFEMPVLFYTVITLLYVTGGVNVATVILAWAYVLGRCIHALIHITSNNLLQRRMAFLASSLVLAILWGMFAAQIY